MFEFKMSVEVILRPFDSEVHFEAIFPRETKLIFQALAVFQMLTTTS